MESTPSDIKQYLEEHGLEKLLKELLTAVIQNRPDRPLEFMVRVLKMIQRKKDIDEPYSTEEITKIIASQPMELDEGADNMEEDEADNFDHTTALNDASSSLSNRFQKSQEQLSTFSRVRRGSVSAESVKPSDGDDDNQNRVIIPKSNEAKMRIASAISNNLLFRNLEDDQRKEIVDAMFEKQVPNGTVVIKQGEEGDNFYVVDAGKFDVLVDNKKVVEIHSGGSFGELALMYNTARAATVVATEDSILWAVDRVTFRRCIVNNTNRKRKLYESFLKTVPILSSLSHSEIVKIADALEPIEFQDDDIIVEQDDRGDSFYILVEGEAVVTKQTEDSPRPVPVKHLKVGDYFGEVALINDSPRAATVTAVGPVKCVTLDTRAFIRLLGPILDILKRNMDEYKKYEHLQQQPQEVSESNGGF